MGVGGRGIQMHVLRAHQHGLRTRGERRGQPAHQSAFGETLARRAAGNVKQATLADKPRDPFAARRSVERFGRGPLYQLALPHDGNAVCHGHGFALVVGDVDHGGLGPPVEIHEAVLHGGPQVAVQVGERFVQQHHVGVGDQAAGQCYPLALAAAEGLGRALGIGGQRHLLQRLGDSALVVAALNAAQLQRVAHVVGHAHMGP